MSQQPQSDEQRAGSDDPPSDVRHGSRPAGTALLHHAATALVVSVGFAIGIWVIVAPPTLPAAPAEQSADGASPSVVQQARAESRRLRILTAVDIFRIQEKAFPPSLDALVERGLLRRADLYYPPKGKAWNYSVGNDDFTLSRP